MFLKSFDQGFQRNSTKKFTNLRTRFRERGQALEEQMMIGTKIFQFALKNVHRSSYGHFNGGVWPQEIAGWTYSHTWITPLIWNAHKSYIFLTNWKISVSSSNIPGLSCDIFTWHVSMCPKRCLQVCELLGWISLKSLTKRSFGMKIFFESEVGR